MDEFGLPNVGPSVDDLREAQEHIHRHLNPAEQMYETLVDRIGTFEASLSPDNEIGGHFIGAPHVGSLRITSLKYVNPNILIFSGTDETGNAHEVIQHHSQMSVALCALPKQADKPKRHFGFVSHDPQE